MSNDPTGERPDGSTPDDAASEAAAEQFESVFDQPISAPARSASPRPGGTKVAVALAIVLALGAGVATFALRSTSAGGTLDDRVPATAMAFGKVSLRPAGDQRVALDAILDRLPPAMKDGFGANIDEGLEEVFAELDLSWKDDIKPWVGAEIGFAVPSINPALLLGGATPDVVVLMSVRSESAAREALEKVFSREDGAFRVEDGIAYIAERAAAVTTFIADAKDGALADDPDYRAATDSFGNNLAFVWVGADVGSTLSGITNLDGPGLPGSASEGKPLAMALRVTEDSVEFVGKTIGAPDSPGSSGPLTALEDSSAGLLGSLSLYDLGAGIEQITELLPVLPIDVSGVLAPFEQLRLDPLEDLAPWMGGEMSIIVSGFDGSVPNVGVVFESTDEDALDRTLAAIRAPGALSALLGAPVDVVGAPDSFTLTPASGTLPLGLAVERGNGRLALAPTSEFAASLLTAAPDRLGDDAVYRRAVGSAGDPTAFQLFVRIDRIRDLVVAFIGAEERAEYEAEAGPIVDLFESLTIKGSSADGGSFRVTLTLAG